MCSESAWHRVSVSYYYLHFKQIILVATEGMDLRAKPDVEKRLKSITLTWRSACTKTEGARTTGSKIPRQTEMSTWEI